MPQVDIIERQNQLNNNAPWSIARVNEKTLTHINPVPSNEVFIQVTGMHIVDEKNTRLKIAI
jgi:hypothetical protein